MKIIFLDVDGVLNSTRSMVAFKGCGFMRDNQSWKQLDPVAIKLLQHVVEETGASVVLSSTWRIGALQEDIEQFSEFLGVEIIAVTGRSPDGIRGKEIQKWLDLSAGVDSFVIVDDDSDMLPSQMQNFVKVDGKVGLTYENVKSILSILNTTV